MSRTQVLTGSNVICMEESGGTVIEVSDKEDLSGGKTHRVTWRVTLRH